MNVTIPVEAEQFVREKVASGAFKNAEEVVREGLRALEQREAPWRAAIDAGWDQASAGNLSTPEEALKRLYQKEANWKNSRDSV